MKSNYTKRHESDTLDPVYTTQPVVKPVEQPVWQPAASCKQTFNRLSNRLFNRIDNRLYRVNGALESVPVRALRIYEYFMMAIILL